MRGMDPLRIGQVTGFGPAELPQSRADVAGADRGTARVSLLQAALTRLPGPALGTGQRGPGTGGAEPGGWHSAGASWICRSDDERGCHDRPCVARVGFGRMDDDLC